MKTHPYLAKIKTLPEGDLVPYITTDGDDLTDDYPILRGHLSHDEALKILCEHYEEVNSGHWTDDYRTWAPPADVKVSQVWLIVTYDGCYQWSSKFENKKGAVPVTSIEWD